MSPRSSSPRKGGSPELVFAFGSNLRHEQMTARCPSASQVGVAFLPKHTLAFVGYSHSWGGGVATVTPTSGRVAGILYEVSQDDLDILDLYEGAPHVYTRSRRFVTTGGFAPARRVAWVYSHTGSAPFPPSYAYFAAIAEGRLRAGLPISDLVSASELAAIASG